MVAIFKTCHTNNFYFRILGFLDPDNMGIDLKLVLLSGLEANILPKRQFILKIVEWPFCFGLYKNYSRISIWHPPDSNSGMVQDDESTINVHNDAKSCLFWIPQCHGELVCDRL